ncbi:uncharacterized protein LOC111692218 [Anoplophora glabripennis]|uniref:uncharacterized protein LOC111692218 n=1 Tax=Anoplophora glabripennis TaxID=217634 RepID=UPI000C77B871|nr:uncharacterized protein LOC111692218 [Anoplophora glabripennis]
MPSAALIQQYQSPTSQQPMPSAALIQQYQSPTSQQPMPSAALIQQYQSPTSQQPMPSAALIQQYHTRARILDHMIHQFHHRGTSLEGSRWMELDIYVIFKK